MMHNGKRQKNDTREKNLMGKMTNKIIIGVITTLSITFLFSGAGAYFDVQTLKRDVLENQNHSRQNKKLLCLLAIKMLGKDPTVTKVCVR